MKLIQTPNFLPNPSPLLQIPSTHLPIPSISSLKTLKSPPQIYLPNPKKLPPFPIFPAIFASLTLPPPSSAATDLLSSDKIDIESILVSIDNFLTRYPFFAATCAFVWLVVVPLTEEYLKKYKFVSAIDAFRKLRDVPEAQLLDIRKRKSLDFMESPNLGSLGKRAVQVEFVEGEEEGFVREVLERFDNPGSTVLCIMDK